MESGETMDLKCDFKDLKKIKGGDLFTIEVLFINSANYKEFLRLYKKSFILHKFDAWEERLGSMSDEERIALFLLKENKDIDLESIPFSELCNVMKCHLNLINGANTGKAGILDTASVYVSNDVDKNQIRLEVKKSDGVVCPLKKNDLK